MKTLRTLLIASLILVSYATALQGQSVALQIASPVPALSEPRPTPTPPPVVHVDPASDPSNSPANDAALEAKMDRLMAQSGPALSPQPDCGVVATEIYNRVKDSYWREIIALDWTAADGKKAKHIACVWIPMAGANVQMFDKKGGTIILPTKDRDKGAITVAFQKLFPKANITHLFFLDEK